MNIEGGGAREDILKDIREIEREIRLLNVAIEEGDVVNDNLNGTFWQILKRTLLFLKQAYVEEACSAAQTPNQSPQFFLGRVANVDDIFNTIEVNFVQGKEKAIERKEILLQRISSLQDILDRKSGEGYTGGTGEL